VGFNQDQQHGRDTNLKPSINRANLFLAPYSIHSGPFLLADSRGTVQREVLNTSNVPLSLHFYGMAGRPAPPPLVTNIDSGLLLLKTLELIILGKVKVLSLRYLAARKIPWEIVFQMSLITERFLLIPRMVRLSLYL
jgi:hypothetical protein